MSALIAVWVADPWRAYSAVKEDLLRNLALTSAGTADRSLPAAFDSISIARSRNTIPESPPRHASQVHSDPSYNKLDYGEERRQIKAKEEIPAKIGCFFELIERDLYTRQLA